MSLSDELSKQMGGVPAAQADATKTPAPAKQGMGMKENYDELHKANVAQNTRVMSFSPVLATISGFASGSAKLPGGGGGVSRLKAALSDSARADRSKKFENSGRDLIGAKRLP